MTKGVYCLHYQDWKGVSQKTCYPQFQYLFNSDQLEAKLVRQSILKVIGNPEIRNET